MDLQIGEDLFEPVSPMGQYLNSSVLSLSILAVLESEIPIDSSLALPLLKDLFLPINPRFSCIMERDNHGSKKWKKVEVKLEEHVKIPVFPEGSSASESYDKLLSEYLSEISAQQLPVNKPLWEVHIIKYPTSRAAGNLIFKIHHSIGDGYSLMGALLSCLKRADDPSLPLTFPSIGSGKSGSDSSGNFVLKIPKLIASVFNTVSDFGFSVLKSSCIEDDKTLIRTGNDGIEFNPVSITNLTFSLDQIKEIKTKLGATINDVIVGMIFLGTRLYMEGDKRKNQLKKSQTTTALVLLNTRMIRGYKPVKDMFEPQSESSWGNRFAFLHISVPQLSDASNPLEFVQKAKAQIKRKRNSAATLLNAHLLDTIRKLKGPEAAASYIHSTLKNSSMAITNMVGPVERMALANHPIKGLYFMVTGVPKSVTVTVMSYMRDLRIAIGTEKEFIDSEKFKSCVEKAFEIIFKAVLDDSATSQQEVKGDLGFSLG